MNQVIAISEDKYWLDAIQKALKDKVTVYVVHCSDMLINCLDCLPKAGINTLLLIDVYSKVSISTIISILFQRGWRYVVVVAADPSVKEAYQVLHESGGYDYWKKTYTILNIQIKVQNYLAEINEAARKLIAG